MIDTHCHLFEEDYDNLDELLKEIFNNNVYCIVNGCDYLTNKAAIQLCCNNGIYASIGYHPTELSKIPENHIKILEEMLLNNKIVAIGEIGLDYHYDYDKEVQKRIFKEQLDLAQKYNLPIIVHSRDAINDVYEMLGHDKTKAGQVVGWVYDPDSGEGDNYVDFGLYDIYTKPKYEAEAKAAFINGYERSVIIDFNVDGNIWEKMA